MSVDLCIVSYNTAPLLLRLYKTFTKSIDDSLTPVRMFFTDNGSTDESRHFLAKMKDWHVADVYFGENVGYARACNRMAACGSSEIIGLLNSDIWFTHQDIDAIQKSFDAHPEMAILGPKQRNEQGLIVHAGIEGTNDAPKHRGWKKPDPNDELYRDFKEMVTVSGSAYFIRRSVWEELTSCPTYRESAPDAQGAFLPTPHFYEETFCSYHAKEHDHKVFYDGSISIGHTWSASMGHQDPKIRQMFLESREIFRKAAAHHGILHD